MITVEDLLASKHFVRDDDVPTRDHYRFQCHCGHAQRIIAVKIEIDFSTDYAPSRGNVMLWFGGTGYLLKTIDTAAKLERLAAALKGEETE